MSEASVSETVLVAIGEIKGLLTSALERTTKLEEKVEAIEKRVWFISGGIGLAGWVIEHFFMK